MFNTSPITSWEGAGAVFNFGPNTTGAVFLFIVSVVLCLIPLWVALRAENEAEKEHGKKN